MELIPRGQYAPEELFAYGRQHMCVICLEPYHDNVEIAFLPCDPRHHFHASCLEQWMSSGCTKCPICNAEVTVEAAEGCRGYEESVCFVKKKDEESFLSQRRSTGI